MCLGGIERQVYWLLVVVYVFAYLITAFAGDPTGLQYLRNKSIVYGIVKDAGWETIKYKMPKSDRLITDHVYGGSYEYKAEDGKYYNGYYGDNKHKIKKGDAIRIIYVRSNPKESFSYDAFIERFSLTGSNCYPHLMCAFIIFIIFLRIGFVFRKDMKRLKLFSIGEMVYGIVIPENLSPNPFNNHSTLSRYKIESVIGSVFEGIVRFKKPLKEGDEVKTRIIYDPNKLTDFELLDINRRVAHFDDAGNIKPKFFIHLLIIPILSLAFCVDVISLFFV